MIIVLATLVLIVLSAFFVAVEFSLMAAKRHRLQESAGTSRMARAALRSSSELTLILAGAQLGITVCTLALGAITKPAVHHALTPVLAGWGLPAVAADVTSFVLALFLVTFLHLVIGEMAPKSWAIAHPERSAVLLALPMRAFMAVTRPVLQALNSAANRLVTTTASNSFASLRFSAPTTVSTPKDRRIHIASMSESRSWLNSTDPTLRFAAHLAAGDRVHLSDTSMLVGRNRSSTSSARHGLLIMRYCSETLGARTLTRIPDSVSVTSSRAPGCTKIRVCPAST